MSNEKISNNFIKNIIIDDLETGKHDHIITRFPPEPNGYLHIGHAKSICLNFGLAKEFNGTVNMRFDDTNPLKEDEEYVNSIKNDIEWLGFKWNNLYFASDYFDEMYNRAVLLIKKGKAYVDDLSADEIRETRGTLTEPGKESPYRNRSIEENLDLFERMKNGEFANGEKVLRAKIDMSSPNINFRDPVIYRISHASHHNTGDKWCIYPMYSFAHPLEDAIEGITHSICTLEFEDQRPLYDWVVRECEMEKVPRQIEFARLNLTNTVMSKRKLKLLVDEGITDGWDDPRMPTISGVRRRGYTPESIRNFCAEIGVSKADSKVDSQLFDHFLREDLQPKAPLAMGILNPLKLVITNYPENQIEMIELENIAKNEEAGTREVPFGSDGNFSEEALINRTNGDLANVLGNLVNRTIGMCNKYFDSIVPERHEYNELDEKLISYVMELPKIVEKNIDTLDIPAALESIIELFRKCNKYIDETTPWILAKENKERLETVIYVLLSAIKHGAVAIKPFLPTTSSKILEQLNITDEDITSFETLKAGTKLNKPEPLFMRINKDV